MIYPIHLRFAVTCSLRNFASHPVLCPEDVGLRGSLGSVESVPCSCPCDKRVTGTGERRENGEGTI